MNDGMPDVKSQAHFIFRHLNDGDGSAASIVSSGNIDISTICIGVAKMILEIDKNFILNLPQDFPNNH